MWKVIEGRSHMYRASGKTWPEITCSNGVIRGRDNNSRRPSAELTSNLLNMDGLDSILKDISLPHPTMEQKLEFLNNIKH